MPTFETVKWSKLKKGSLSRKGTFDKSVAIPLDLIFLNNGLPKKKMASF